MRFTVYGEDLRPDRTPKLLREGVRDEPGNIYYGVQLFLGPDNVHKTGDDDMSAVKFFAPQLPNGDPDLEVLMSIFQNAIDTVHGLQMGLAVKEDLDDG